MRFSFRICTPDVRLTMSESKKRGIPSVEDQPCKEEILFPKEGSVDWRLPPCVAYVPLNVVKDLEHKLTNNRKTLRRADVLRVIPDKADMDAEMVPIFVDMKLTLPLFVKLGLHVWAFEYSQWPWLVKRLVRECGKFDVADMIIAARTRYRDTKKRCSLPTISAEQWMRMLAWATCMFGDPEDPQYWEDDYVIPRCGWSDAERSHDVVTINVDA